MTSDVSLLAREFLEQHTIAVVGVSAQKQTPANAVYKKMRLQHRNVVAVNPHCATYDGDPCYPDLASIPGRVDAVFISTKPETASIIAEECIRLSIPRVWMHDSMGVQRKKHSSAISSVSMDAVARCREKNISVIAGACPMMFLAPVDGFHACLRWVLSVTGKMKTA